MFRKEKTDFMKNLLHKKRIFAKSAFLLLAFSLMTVTSCSKGNSQLDRTNPGLTPRYLLNGTFSDTTDIFDYYDIGNNEYAVALNGNYKTTYTQTINVPEMHNNKKVTGIWRNAFHCSPATTINLTNNITTIDFEAFLSSSITEIDIPYSVSEIGDAAFYLCEDLESVTFVNSDQESSGSATDCYCDANGNPIGGGQVSQEITYSTLTTIPSYCFFKCSSLTTLALPSGIQEVCEEAFNGCYSLNSPIYFQNIKKIRTRAFQGCAELRKVYISKSLFTDEVGIEPHAFNYCSTLAAPDNLDIVFCGETATVNTWIGNHPNWGWYTDREDPSANKYTARIETGDTFFSADWDYTCDPNGDVTITKYNGPVPTAATGYFISVPDHMPTPANNRVIRISRDTFTEATKQALRRLYLPKSLVDIENNMFNFWNASGGHVGTIGDSQINYNDAHGYKNLSVVDDNTKCVIDKGLYDAGNESSIEKRIDLSGLTELEFIGFRAFSGIGGKTANSKIKALRLPAKLRSVGDEAFGIFNCRMLPGVTEFTWGFDEATSILETIGADAFYGLGLTGSGQINSNSTWKQHTTSTIIFPKTFKYFANTSSDKTRYRTQAVHPFDFSQYTAVKNDRPAHAFAGCSLMSKVIFKGGAEAETVDLVVPLQTFVFNESLRTVVFEERVNHHITFHTQQGSGGSYNYAQESIGANAGRGENDFRGEPFLQTLVLPNKNTKLRFQSFAFRGNSRAAIYLSGSFGTNMYSDAKNGVWTSFSFEDNSNLSRAIQWKTIGDESYFTSKDNIKYWGYVFGSANTGDYRNDKSVGTYDIDQQIPVYENVHYKDSIDVKGTPSNPNDDVSVEVGAGNAREYVETNHCSFVAGLVGGHYVATMTNYNYSLYDDKTSAEKLTAHVPEEITANISGTDRTCSVNKIGDSAFSACYCDGKDTNPTKTVGSFDDLRTIELPNTITSIGDYAFTRAYGVTTIKSYSGSDTPTEGMPSNLRHIGKHAFLFSSVKKVLKIPNECRFYETYSTYQGGVIDDAETPGAPGYTTTSTFSAANDLRRISFWKNGAEVDSSDYYETTTYTSSTNNETRTCALYSKNHANLSHNTDRLLLVLNRDNADAKKASANNADCETVTRNNSVVGLRFNGLYKTNPFLFGAFKMGYWILDLTCGHPTLGANSATLPQPIISGVGSRSSNNSTLKTSVIYLGKAIGTYDNLKCDLDTISGNVLSLPQYAMNGCEKLANVELPIQQGGVLPEGVFAGVTNSNTTYYVEGNTPVAHTLDLTDSQYSEIGPNVFNSNTSIYYLTAPDVNEFTIGSGAFESCTGLQTIDFSTVNTNLTLGSSAFNGCTNLTSVDFGSISGSLSIGSSAFAGCTKLDTINFGSVTGSVTINGSAFNGCGSSNGTITLNFTNITGSLTIKDAGFKASKVASITWPSSSSCQVKIQSEAFYDCDKLTSLTIPSNLSGEIGTSSFCDCDNLVTVTLASTMSGKLGESAFSSCDKLESVTVDGNSISLTNIGSSAFKDCTKLDDFEFSKFTSLTTISSEAFRNAGKLSATGQITLPNGVTTIGSSAFRGSKITVITFTTSTSLSLADKCFADCSSLQAVRFTSHTCGWGQYKNGIFDNCTSLTELQLPTGFNLNNQGNYDPNADKFFIEGDASINLYSFTKYSSSVQTSPEWRAIENGVGEKPVYFFVETVSDLLTSGVIADPGSVLISDVPFWTVDNNGVAINLGTVTGYNGTTVTFSSGYTLDSTGFHI